MKRISFVRLLLAVLLVLVCSVSGFMFYQAGNYYDHLDAYSGHISRQDQSPAKEGLKDLQYFYDQNRKLGVVGLSWVAERYLFQDMACQRSAFYNLDRNFDKTVEELKDKEGFCAFFLRANARWRQAQAIYANGLTLPDKTDEQKAEKARQLKLADDIASTLVRDDYMAALKANPSHHPSSWNYDLVSNPDTRAKGLRPKPGQIRVRLGQGAGGGKSDPGPLGENDKGLGNKSKDIDTKDEGPGKPGSKPRKVD